MVIDDLNSLARRFSRKTSEQVSVSLVSLIISNKLFAQGLLAKSANWRLTNVGQILVLMVALVLTNDSIMNAIVKKVEKDS